MATLSYEQIVNDGFLYVSGLIPTYVSTTTFTMSTGQCRDFSNQSDMINSSVVTVSTAFVGVNGLDTGTVATSTLYYIYGVWDISNVLPMGFVLSLSASAPVMPAGYSTYRLLGAFATNSSSQLLLTRYYGTSNVRYVTYDIVQSVLSTSSPATTATAVGLGAVVPAISNIPVYIEAKFTPNAASDTLNVVSTSTSSTTVVQATGQVAAVVLDQFLTVPATLVSAVPTVYYLASTASAAVTLYVVGYTMTL